jgi:hypothetical protein
VGGLVKTADMFTSEAVWQPMHWSEVTNCGGPAGPETT